MHNGAPELALEVFRDMKTWPNFDGPDANTYSAMLCGLAKYGYLREAAGIASEACLVLRQAIDSSALQQLFRALRADKSLDLLRLDLVAKLRDARATQTSKTRSTGGW